MGSLEENKYIKNAINAVSILRHNKTEFFQMIMLDVLYFFILGLASAPIVSKVIGLSGILFKQVITNMQKKLVASIFSVSLRGITYKLIFYAFLLLLIYYFLYILFQGYIWALVKKICNKKTNITNIKETVLKFALLNLFWMMLFVFYKIMDLFTGIRGVILKNSNIQSADYLSIFVAIVLIISAYFIPLTYVYMSIKKGLKTGLMKIHKIFPIYLLIIIIYLVMNFTITLIPITEMRLLLQFVFYLPLLSWARIYINTTVEEV